MCSSANPTELALQQSQASFTNTLQSSFSTAFAANQSILGNLSSTLTKMVANPTGYTPAEMAALRTGATDTVASQTADAERADAAYGASHGGADLGSGVQAQIEGQTTTAGMEQQSQEQNQITVANAQQQQQNYWNAISGLTQVGNAYNPTGYAGAETNAANSTTSASNAVTAEQEQGWQNAFGVVQGVAGLATAAAGLPSFGGGGLPSADSATIGSAPWVSSGPTGLNAPGSGGGGVAPPSIPGYS
jgi:hypothetical protein